MLICRFTACPHLPCNALDHSARTRHAGGEIKSESTVITAIVITHLNPDVLQTLAKVVTLVRTRKDTPVMVHLSNPAKTVIDAKLGDEGFEVLADESKVKFNIVKDDTSISVGRRSMQCITASTPRYPDLLALYERTTRRLFSSCFFSAHVNPQEGQQGAHHSFGASPMLHPLC